MEGIAFYTFLAFIFTINLTIIPNTRIILHKRKPIQTLQTKITLPKILTINRITQLILQHIPINTTLTSNLIKNSTITSNT